MQVDVKDEFHKTTLGPYSFHLFVSAVITHTTLKTKEARDDFLSGRRTKVNPRALAKRISYTLERVTKRKQKKNDSEARPKKMMKVAKT
jgi:hypothetical protein